MSYSFGVVGTDKADAKAQIAAKFTQLVVDQAIHSKDCEPATVVCGAFIDMLADDDEKDIHVSVSGSVSWTGDYALAQLRSAHITVTTSVQNRTVTPG